VSREQHRARNLRPVVDAEAIGDSSATTVVGSVGGVRPPTLSTPDLLTLHAVRLNGMADDARVANRFGLDLAEVAELLLDFQAYGWISRVDFAGTGGWTLTAAGLAENQRQLAAEVGAGAGADVVRDCYRRFLPRNGELQQACTDWQLRPTTSDPLAGNDHFDLVWDRRVLESLDVLDAALSALVGELTDVLARFAGYDDRFDQALGRAQAGDPAWVTGVGIDSCHSVWMELHEDLLATLGLERGAEPG
jgi:hypothetical protein